MKFYNFPKHNELVYSYNSKSFGLSYSSNSTQEYRVPLSHYERVDKALR